MTCSKLLQGADCPKVYETAPNMWCRECRIDRPHAFLRLLDRKVDRIGALLINIAVEPSAAAWEEIEHLARTLKSIAEGEAERLNVMQPEQVAWAAFPVCSDKCPRFRSGEKSFCSGPDGHAPTVAGGICGPHIEQRYRDQASKATRLETHLENLKKEKGNK